ncbi:MAG: type II toxin-antitoxin system VapB family antitoxin [bacterium]|nr:type II toxin-antitoxin system VapB family antitoxin [bacterium]
MRTTLNIDDRLLEQASRLTGETEKTSLVRLGRGGGGGGGVDGSASDPRAT